MRLTSFSDNRVVERGRLLTNDNSDNITKIRYMDDKSNHAFFRVDTPHNIRRIDVETVDVGYDLVVISDYDKGFLTEDDIEYICNNHDLVFLDTKKILGSWAKGASYIKINDNEYQSSINMIDDYLMN